MFIVFGKTSITSYTVGDCHLTGLETNNDSVRFKNLRAPKVLKIYTLD